MKLLNYNTYSLDELVKELQHRVDNHVGDVIVIPKMLAEPLLKKIVDEQDRAFYWRQECDKYEDLLAGLEAE